MIMEIYIMIYTYKSNVYAMFMLLNVMFMGKNIPYGNKYNVIHIQKYCLYNVYGIKCYVYAYKTMFMEIYIVLMKEAQYVYAYYCHVYAIQHWLCQLKTLFMAKKMHCLSE